MELKGLGGARGQAVGKCLVLKDAQYKVECIKVSDAEQEIMKLEAARNKYREELEVLYEKTLQNIGKESAEIFSAYREMVNDDIFFENPIKRVREEKINMEYALEEEKKVIVNLFSGMEDLYMKERGSDIENVCNTLIKKMLGIGSPFEASAKAGEDFILIAQDLTPADTVRLDKTYLKGFVTEKGGQTSHTVILAKMLGIPAVVSAEGIMEQARSGEVIYIDGQTGEIIFNPDQSILDEYEKKCRKRKEQMELLSETAQSEAVSLDGHITHICVNAGDISGIEKLNISICDGVGLFRTEFLYMAEKQYPSEETQFKVYRKLAERGQGKEIIIRTLDIGGDKQIDYMGLTLEANPFLGYRAIRICLDKQEIFKTQLRAILRASVYGKISIMFPMIVNLEELRKAKELVQECMKELLEEKIKYDSDIKIGIMIETPAAVLLSDKLAQEADFFSIGTNDLIQYVTATDRMNEKVQYLYKICNISVLRAIAETAKKAHAAGIPIGICGEAASDEKMVPVWLGLGIDKLSMVSGQVSRIKYIIRHLETETARKITDTVFALDTADEIEEYLKEKLKRFEEIL